MSQLGYFDQLILCKRGDDMGVTIDERMYVAQLREAVDGLNKILSLGRESGIDVVLEYERFEVARVGSPSDLPISVVNIKRVGRSLI